ncbi:MAG: DUF6273 domain-containing protein, partial [Endomicrobium sp.]|nr:DUF6273 domain-containing protein [Endomicrobium sp.]
PTYKTAGGEDTTDKIFLLSIDEANEYFGSDQERIAKYNGKGAWWWLRSPDYDGDCVANVGMDGNVIVYGSNVNYGATGVRPALWLNL